ncbi:MAG: CocE/NonD family hydrolase C-terminal non-catalytic domain-containing protein [Umezawaea sp.]
MHGCCAGSRTPIGPAPSIAFLAGHRIRVQITSNNFPRWDRNLNTGEPSQTATTMRTAHQTIFHESARPSAIILPVIPRPL